MSKILLERVQLEIPVEKLSDLMSQGVLHAADIRCLDGDSKECVKHICLQACSKRLGKGC